MDTKTEKKWIERWQDAKIFESSPDDRKKFFGTFPYPYVNSYLHLGHFYSSMKLEALSRYKRMNGFNVLYAQGWHCTGSPIVSSAKRIADKEPKQTDILRKQGFSEEQIVKFADPQEWIRYFPKEARKDFTEMGYSIDWRREFITTSLNPHYDRFIRWQFSKLKEKGYVVKGKFPVVWDPVDNAPVGDHDRIEGEGETPQEYVLVKHKYLGPTGAIDTGAYIVTATLRPDTIMGVTNLYVNPESDLVEAKVDDELWIVSEKVAHELNFQDKRVKVVKKVKGASLIGLKVREFSGLDVIVLPASFVATEVGTGIVHSVPSDSADDLVALYDVQNDEGLCRRFGLDQAAVRAIKPIAVLEIPGYGKIPAEDIVKKLGIKNQKDHDKLAQAKDILYKDGYYKGKLNQLYAKKFSKGYAGMKVEDVKELIKEEIIASEYGDRYYQLTGRVLARSLGECIVKIVDDQWFMAYGNEEWKGKAHKCLDSMRLYPENTRTQFNYVIDWLRNWACTREFGLGTRLPWDEKWLIESLSDSTIYMAYYTISERIRELPPEKLDYNFFDYVFLGKGKKEDLKVDVKTADEMRREFEYWYPLDFRNTGKDLIQNHMTFCIFNHIAVFPEKHWPRSFGLNGHVMVDGVKMSKSRGNFIIMREAHRDYGADASRFTALTGGEGIDDANFDREVAKAMGPKLDAMLDFAKQNYGRGRDQQIAIDAWLDQKMDSVIEETTKAFEDAMFRSALQKCYFELQNALKWYLRRTVGSPHKGTMKRFIEVQALLLAPITPFVCEEIWEAIGKKGFIAQAGWPKAGKRSGSDSDILEKVIETTVDDIGSVMKLIGMKNPSQIKIMVSPAWKYRLVAELDTLMKKERDFGKLMQAVMKDNEFKAHSKDITNMIQKALKSGKSLESPIAHDDELKALSEATGFIRSQFGCEVVIEKAEASKEAKAAQAMPGKPAIIIS